MAAPAVSLTLLTEVEVRQRLMLSLPPSDWPEVQRRLLTEPAVWQAVQQPTILLGLLAENKAAALTKWQPGRVGLRVISETWPESAGGPLAWLADEGRRRLVTARQQAETEQPTLGLATLLAASLHPDLQKRSSTWPALLAKLPANKPAWALAIVCLYGLLEDPQPLLNALLASGQADLVRLGVRVWVANSNPATTLEALLDNLTGQPLDAWLQAADALHQRGYRAQGQAVADAAGQQAAPTTRATGDASLMGLVRQASDQVERALLADLAEHPDTNDRLSAALTQAQQLTTALAVRLGQAALRTEDAVSALTAFQEAERFASGPTELAELQAQALMALDRPEDVLAELRDHTSPMAAMLCAQAHMAVGELDAARTAALAGVQADAESDILLGLADVLTHLEEFEAARQALDYATPLNPETCTQYTALAEALFLRGDLRGTLDLALQAALLQPDYLPARRLVARALYHRGNASAALMHWQALTQLPRATANDWVGLAESALENGQPGVARTAAQRALSQTSDTDTFGRAQVCMAEALLAQGDVTTAYSHVQRALSAAPQDLRVWQAKARCHQAQGNAPQALAALESGLQALNDNLSPAQRAAFFTALAEARHEAQQTVGAIEAYSQALALLPDQLPLRQTLIKLLLENGESGVAIDLLRESTERFPNQVDLWQQLAAAYQQTGQAQAALNAYQQAQRQTSPHSTEFLAVSKSLGHYAFDLERFDLAQPALESIAAQPDPDSESLVRLGKLYEQQERPADALLLYKQTLQQTPERADVMIRLGVCTLALGDPDSAIAALAQIENAEGEDAIERLRTLGQAYAARRLWQEALKVFEQAQTLTPNDISLQLDMARAAAQCGETQQAVAVLQAAVQQHHQVPELWQALGNLHTQARQWPEALAVWQQFTALQPTDVTGLRALAQAALQLDELSAAIQALEAVLAVDAECAEAAAELGEIYAQIGQTDMARNAYQKAVTGAPQNAGYLWQLGQLEWEQGHAETAIKWWERARQTETGLDAEQMLHYVQALIDDDQTELAYQQVKAGVEQHPQSAALQRVAAGLAQKFEDATTALGYLQHVLLSSDATANDFYRAGGLYLHQGQAQLALDAFAQACARHPELALFSAGAAKAALAAGKRSEAQIYVDRALRIAQPQAEALTDSFAVLIGLGEFDRALALSQQAIQQQPGNPLGHMALAQALIMQMEAEQPARLAEQVGAGAPQAVVLLCERATQALKAARELGASVDETRTWLGRITVFTERPDKALRSLAIAAEQQPNAELQRALAFALRRAERLEDANQALRQALQLAPIDPLNLLELAELRRSQGDPDGVVVALQQFTEQVPHVGAGFYLLGCAWLELDSLDPALDALQQAVALNDDEPNWHVILGKLYCKTGETAQAEQHFRRAVQLGLSHHVPDDMQAHFHATLADALHLNDPRAALQQYEAALQLKRDEPLWWLAYGRLCRQTNAAQSASEAISYAAEVLNEPVLLLEAAEVNFAAGYEAPASKQVAQVLALDPNNAQALVLQGALYAWVSDYAAAMRSYQAAADLLDDPTPAWMAMAQLQLTVGNPEAAIETLRVVASLPDREPDAAVFALRAEALLAMGHNAEAEAALHQAVRLSPHQARYYLQLGELDIMQGQLDKALQYLTQARDLAPDNAHTHYLIGEVFARRRTFPRALEAYEQAIGLDNQQADYYYAQGLMLKQLKDTPAAIKAMEHALECDPDHKGAKSQHTLLMVQMLGAGVAR